MHVIGLEVLDPAGGFQRFYRSTYFDIRTSITRLPIAVVGMACHYPGAPTLGLFWENILARRREFRRIPDQRLPLSEYYDPDPEAPDKTFGTKAAVIDGFEFDWVRRGIPKTVIESSDISHWLALKVALEAMEDAGYHLDRVPSDRSGVIVGNTLTGEFSRAQAMRLRWPFVHKTLKAAAARAGLPDETVSAVSNYMETYYKSVFAPVTEDTLAGNLSNTIAGRICNFLNLNGGGYTVDGACSSSLMAVSTAATALTNGNLDLVLAGGVDISLDTFELVGFAKTQALTKDHMRVYDRRANGFIPGEGAGFVVLKRLDDARADGDRVYAVLRGWGTSSDGKGGITAPKAETQALAIRRAYTGVDYKPGDVDFIEGHGTGTPAGDRAELIGIAKAMEGRVKSPHHSCGITSLKSIIGHTKAASGIGGFIKAVIALNRRVLPPTANCTEPTPVFAQHAPMLYPILNGEIRPHSSKLRAGVSAMGFGGINCHVTLESGDVPASKLTPALDERKLLASAQETELFIVSAASVKELLDRVREVSQSAQGLSESELVDLACDLSRNVIPAAPLRAAVIADSPEALLKSLLNLETLLMNHPPAVGALHVSAMGDVLIGNGREGCRLGFLFPGQGSQQVNMARTIVERHDWARELVAEADRCLQEFPARDISRHIFRSLEKSAGKEEVDAWTELLKQSEISQPAICLASLLWDRKLRRLGLAPVAVGGHSLGELSAFFAAGAFDETALLKLAALRGETMAAQGAQAGVMASLACAAETATDILSGVGGYAVVANLNAPEQVVISGEPGSVKAAVAGAREKGISAHLLAVSNAFHSRFVEGAAERLRLSAPVPHILGPLETHLFSGVGGRQIKEGLKLCEHIADQVVSQVDFVALVQAVAKGCDLLVEVGPGKVLTGLVSSITGLQGPPALPVESTPGRDRDLNTLLAHYYVQGGRVRWDALYEDRLVRPFIPASARTFIENPCEHTLEAGAAGDLTLPLAAADPLDAIMEKVPWEGKLSPQVWSAYLARRGSFLREVIQADLKHFNLSETSAAGGQVESVPATFGKLPPVDIKKRTPSSIEEIEEMVLELVVARTGFPRETLSLDMRLLDDLNLDSIKAGAIIADAATQVGAAGEVDPADLVNAALKELAGRLQSKLQERGRGPAKSPITPQETRWVRDYTMVETEQALSFSTPTITWDQTRVLLLHDRSEKEVAAALQACFQRRGADVSLLTFEETGRLRPEDLDEITCYITLLPRRQGADSSLAERLPRMIARLQCLAGFPFAPNASTGKITAAYVQFGGGNFGFHGGAGLEQCSAKALAAGFHLERPDLRVRVIDLSPKLDLGQSGELVIREIEAPGNWEAAGYDEHGVRRVPRARIRDRAGYIPRPVSWSKEDVVLVTGGGKGISAECALAFAGATGVRMALVGSSPHPESGGGLSGSAVARTLERFETAGIDCSYYSCDISDERAVASLVVKISAEMGKISGVIHGAAKNQPRSFSRVSRQEAYDEVAPKVLGAWNLGRVLGDTGLKMFAAMSSIIGVTGMGRSAWYGFANEAQDLIMAGFSREHPETAVISLAFSVWDHVGMGVRLGSLSHLKRMGVGPIGVREGVESFLKLTLEDAGATRVVIASLLGGLDTWRLERPLRPAAQRYLEEILFDDPGRELVARAHLSVQRDPYLKDHLWHGSMLFPTVFGLEAMAQAAAQAKGLRELPPLCLEDVQLERPIVVPQEKSLTIELRARALEGDPNRIRVAIFTEQTGYSKEHFAATFCFDFDGRAPVETLELPHRPLPIEPRRDLYSGLLFQGPRFQRIRVIHSLVEKKAVLESELKVDATSRQTGDYPQSPADSFLLGDPYFRDSLLQSCQLVATQDECLPVRIERLEIFLPGPLATARRFVSTTLDKTDRQEHFCTVTAVDPDGRVAERLMGCRLRILSHHEERPTASDLSDPGNRDRRILRETLQGVRDELCVSPPAIEISFAPGLHRLPKERRHEVELPVMERVVRSAIGDQAAFRVDWTAAGQPVVQGPEGLEQGISVAHDAQYLIAVAGAGHQGCDLEVIQEREEYEWKGLLGNNRPGILGELVAQGDERHTAGTRLWCVAEAWRKATGSVPEKLRLVARSGGKVIFGDSSSGELSVLTFTVSFTFGPTRMVACVFPPVRRAASRSDRTLQVQEKTATDYGYDGRIFSLDVDVGPQGQLVYVQHFPATFKVFQNRSRTVYFSAYFHWMGDVREYALYPVMDRLHFLSATGGWGLATNSSETRIFDDLQRHDIVESRLWMEREVGDLGASFDWLFDWRRVLPEGGTKRIAFSRLRTTWIQIMGHGVARTGKMPDFLEEFIGAMKPGVPDRNEPIPLHNSPGDRPGPGRLLARVSEGPGVGPVLHEDTFKTSLEDSNLVGNVYFANYALWQGRIRDQFFYRLAPRFYRGNGEEGELRCRWVKIDHIREAMPFDHVQVSMHLQAVHEHGAELKFEYHRVTPGEERIKLASSTHDVLWMVPGPDGRPSASALPEEFRLNLLKHAGRDPFRRLR